MLSTFTSAFVAFVSYRNANIKKIHPSGLIGAMAVAFLLVNWHVFVWKIGEVDMICYIGAEGWFQSLVAKFGGKMTSEEAIKFLVHSNQSMFKIFLQVSLILNTFLSLDLIYTNQDPLKPSRKRIQLYFIITGVLTFITFFATSRSLLTPTKRDLLFYFPKTVDEHKKLQDSLASGNHITDLKGQWNLR